VIYWHSRRLGSGKWLEPGHISQRCSSCVSSRDPLGVTARPDGSDRPQPMGGRPGYADPKGRRAWLLARIKKLPSRIALWEDCGTRGFGRAAGTCGGYGSVWRFFATRELTFKTTVCRAPSRDGLKSPKLARLARCQATRLAPTRRVVPDETWAKGPQPAVLADAGRKAACRQDPIPPEGPAPHLPRTPWRHDAMTDAMVLDGRSRHFGSGTMSSRSCVRPL